MDIIRTLSQNAAWLLMQPVRHLSFFRSSTTSECNGTKEDEIENFESEECIATEDQKTKCSSSHEVNGNKVNIEDHLNNIAACDETEVGNGNNSEDEYPLEECSYYTDDDEEYYLDSADDKAGFRFTSEPLYQYYHSDADRRNSCSDGDEDGFYETYGYHANSETEEIEIEIKRDLSEEKTTKDRSLQRSLWCELPEVKQSGILNTLTESELKRQEAMFEVITSEASYLRSLNILINNFVTAPEFSLKSPLCIISRNEKHHLFSNIVSVRAVSEKVMADLESRWKENILISDISDIIANHASNSFDVYIKYCSNTIYQERTLTNLKKSNTAFLEALTRLEQNPKCEGLSMHSFLLLPMQRITRLPLLVEAVKNRLELESEQYRLVNKALSSLRKIVVECNEGSRKMERMEQMYHINQQLDFKIKKIPLVSAARWLVKKGELIRIMPESSAKLPFGKRKPATQPIYLYLFTDILLVTKKKSEESFSVVDYAWRSFIEANSITKPETCPKLPNGVPSGCKYIFELIMLENYARKHVELMLACNSENEFLRWMDVLTTSGHVDDSGEKVYELWDCPQVEIIHNYVAQQPDEISLEEKDVVNVLRKLGDGWFEGERLNDGERGWFPGNHAVELANSHLRAKNLRARYHLLAASHAYVEQRLKCQTDQADNVTPKRQHAIKRQTVGDFIL